VTEPSERLWRVFPWDPSAEDGAPFSASYVPPVQGKGRFDLPGIPAGVLYLAESPEHAIGETIQHFRGARLDAADLIVRGCSLALANVTLPTKVRSGIVDLCDPGVLAEAGIRPDRLASRSRAVTQQISAELHAGGRPGLRWWSALSGDWHTLVIFRDRLEEAPAYGQPESLTLTHTALREAASALGLPLDR
jgi:hypothetical protein